MTVCRDVGELDRRNEYRHQRLMSLIKNFAYVNLIGQAGFIMIAILMLRGII